MLHTKSLVVLMSCLLFYVRENTTKNQKRMEVILSNTAVEINERSKEEGKSVYTFSLLCGLLMSLDPKSGSDIVSLYGQRKGKIIENQLLTLQPIVEAETSTKKTLTKAVSSNARANPFVNIVWLNRK